MATKRKLQIRYGAAASRPTLATGELGLDTDTGSEALYVGTPAGNKQVANLVIKRYVATIKYTSGTMDNGYPKVKTNTLGSALTWSINSGPPYNISAQLPITATQDNTLVQVSPRVYARFSVSNGTFDNSVSVIGADTSGNNINSVHFDINIEVFS
jgi:hypothetical protein